MGYAKAGVLLFGLGLLLGLVTLAAEFKSLERVASGLMALGIAGIPFGMVADWGAPPERRHTLRDGRARLRRAGVRTSPAASENRLCRSDSVTPAHRSY